MKLKELLSGTSLVAQWLRRHTPNSRGLGLIRGLGNRKILNVTTKDLTHYS